MQTMATGDLQGNLDRVRSQLRQIGYPHPLEVQGLREGIPATLLPLLHFALLGYSRHVAHFLSSNGYELYAKSDLRFMECLLKFMRSEFGYRCPLTLAQIFSRGFAERKLLFLHDVIQACKRKHNELSKAARLENSLRKVKSEHPMLDGYVISKENNCRNLKQDLEFSLQNVAPSLSKVVPTRREVSAADLKTDHEAMNHQIKTETQGGNDLRSPKPGRDTEVVLRDDPRRVPLSNKLQYQKNTDNILAQVLEEERPSHGEVNEGSNAKKELNSLQTVSLHRCYIEMKEKIVSIADRIEKRFSALEESIARTSESLEKKITVLEDRLHCLEQGLTNHNATEPASGCLRASFVAHQHQHMGSPNTYDVASSSGEKTFCDGSLAFASAANSALKYQKFLSTQELIASVRARCNKTNELLNHEWSTMHFHY